MFRMHLRRLVGSVFILAAFALPLRAQTTAMAGDWNDPNTWGGSVPGPTDNVSIQHDVTISTPVTTGNIQIAPSLSDVTLSITIGSLSAGNLEFVESGFSSGTFDAGGSLATFSGSILLDEPSNGGVSTLRIGTGVVRCVSVAVNGSDPTKMVVEFYGDGVLELSGGIDSILTLTNHTGGVGSTIKFNGSFGQNIFGGFDFQNLVLENIHPVGVVFNGAIDVAGTLWVKQGTGSFLDAITDIGNGASLTMDANTTLNLGNGQSTFNNALPDFTGGRTLNATSKIVYGARATQTINPNIPYQNLEIAYTGPLVAEVVKALGGNTTVAGNLSIVENAGSSDVQLDTGANVVTVGGDVTGLGDLVMTTGNLVIGGLFSHTGGFDPGTGTVTYGGVAIGANARNTTYNNLVFSNTGTRHFSGNFTVNNNLTINAGAFVDLNTGVMTVAGDVTVDEALNDGILSMTGSTRQLGGDTGIFGAAVSLFTGATITVPATANLQFLSNTSLNTGAMLTNLGTIDADASINGSGTWINAAGSQLSVTGSIAAPLTASANPNTVIYDGIFGQTVKGTTYHHLVLNAPGTTTKTPDGAIIVNGDFTTSGTATTFDSAFDVTVAGSVSLTNTTYNAIDDTLTVGGNWSRTGGSFVPGTSMVVFNGTASQSISPTTFHNVSFDNPGPKSPTGAMTIEGHVTLTDDAVVNAGSFAHTVRGNWTLATGGVFNAGTSTVTFDGAGAQVIDATTFHNLAIANTSLIDAVSLNGNVTVGGNFSLLDGDFDLITSTIDVAGSFLVETGTNFIGNDGDINLAGAIQTNGLMTSDAGVTYVFGPTVQNWTGTTVPQLNALYVDKASGSLNTSVNIDLDDILTLEGGALVVTPGNWINILATGSIQRDGTNTVGWIDGRLNQTHATLGAKLYPFGTTLGYSPVTITISAPGQLDASITNGPQGAETGSNRLGIFWTIHNTATAGPPLTLDFAYPVSAVAGTESAYIIARHDGVSWSHPGGTVNDVSHTANISGVSAPFTGDWTVGEPASVGGVSYFEVTSDGSADAGVSETITVTAKDALNNTVAGYTGSHTLHFTGANASPDGTTPKAIDNSTAQIEFGNDTAITFTAGSANVSVLLYEANSPTINVAESPTGPAGSAGITVNPGPATELVSTGINAGLPVYVTYPFTLGIGSADSFGNLSAVSTDTSVQLTLASGGGTLGGTLTGTILSGDQNTNISDLTYDVAESVTVTATALPGGDSLTPVNVPFTVDPQAGSLVVTSTADSGADTLRDIINRVNLGECAAPCNVAFAIAGTGPHVITLVTRLPDVFEPIVIDGTTEPDYVSSPVIYIDGNGLSNAMTIQAAGSTVRGLAFGNVSGNALFVDADNTTITQSWFGLDPTGTTASANTIGVRVDSNSNTISDNVFSGNTTGLQLASTATSNTVIRNLIGTNPSGTAAIPNTSGLRLTTSATSNTIGGLTAADANVISGNTGVGITLSGTGIVVIDSTGGTVAAGSGVPGDVTSHVSGVVELNVIQNNLIGVQIDGTSALPNGGVGINLANSAAQNVIRWNTIANNAAGIIVVNSDGNVFSENAVYDNTALGIDLGDDGATPNDLDDSDTGANNLQNTPVLASAILDSFGNATVAYNVDSGLAGAGSIRFELFKADSMISGEGMQLLTSQCTAGNDFATTATFPAGTLVAGNVLVGTATAFADTSCTTASDGTSEFSAGATIVNCTAPTPTITATGSTTFCTGGSVTLTSSAADSYLWSNGATTQSIVVTTGGSYSVTTTTSGCNATSAATSVTVTPAPTAVITAGGPTTFCDGDSVTLTASAGDSWLWSTGETTQTIVVSTGGSYTVTVTTSGCSTTSSPTTVTVNPSPIVAIAGPASMCDGGSVTLDAGTGFATYAWSTGATSQTIVVSPTADTTYSVTVTDGNTCSASDTHTVTVTPALTPVITGPATVCPGGSVTLDAGIGFATYLWSTGETTQTISVSPTGPQTYTVTVSDGSCNGSDSHTVTVAAVATPTITPDGPTTFCSGENVTLTASAGDSYLWSTGATTQSITVSTSGSYDVEVTTGGCAATSAPTAVTVLPKPVVNISAPTTAEPGETLNASVTAQTGASYSWSIVNGTIVSGQTSNAITFTTGTSGQTQLTVDATLGGCSRSDTHTIDLEPEESPSADLSITKTAPAAVGTGAQFAYTLVIRNNGPSKAQLVMDDPMPDGVIVLGVAGGSLDCQVFGSLVSCTGRLAAGADTQVVIDVDAPQSAGTITNTASLSSPISDPESANNSASANTTVETTDCGTPTAPQIASPAAGAVVTPLVTFSWTPVPGAIGYRLWAEINGTEAQDIGSTDGATSLTLTLPAGALTVSVEALFSSCPSVRSAGVSFQVVPPDPCAGRTQAFPLAPANAAVLGSSLVTFQWNPANEPDGYRVWYVRDGGTAQVIGQTVDETSFEASLEEGTYEWWIESLYDGCASTESEHRTFSIPQRSGCEALSAELLTPRDGAVVNDALVDFHWTEVPSAVRYEVWLSVDRGTPSLVGQSEITSLTTEVADGQIEWFVKAIADRCPSILTDASKFSLQSPDACSGNRRATTVAPLSRSLVQSPVDFSWTEVENATHYEVFVRRGSNPPVSVGSTTDNHLDDIAFDNGNVRWFVRAYFPSCIPLDSAEDKFQVVPATAACGTLDSPLIAAVAQVSSGIPFLIQWNEIPGASSYQLQVAANAQFDGAQTFTTQSPSHSLTRTNESGDATPVFARVRAVDSRCPRSNLSAYSPTAAIYVLPIEGSEGATPAGNGAVTHTIVLGPELAGQTFVVSVKEPWLTAQPMSGEVGPNGTDIHIVADTAGLPFGSNLASVIVTLSTPDSGGLTSNATSIKPSTITVSKITPVSPTPKSTPPPDALIIPAVAHANGFNSQFQSDVRVTNSSAKLINYQLTFIPSGSSGIATGRQTTFAIEAGKTVALDDVLRSWFGTGTDSVTGTLEVRPLTQTASATSNAAFAGLVNLVTFASSRTFNTTSNGTFGQYIPAIPYANFLGAAPPGTAQKILSLQQIAQSEKYRTNLGIVEGSGEPVSLLVKVFGDAGQKLTEFPLTLAGGQHTQLNSFLAERGITSLNDGRVEISVTSPAGKVTAYASVLDNETSDPLLVTPVALSDQGNTKWVVPGVADLNSGAANWQTDMRIFNADETDVDVTLTFHSQNGGAPKTATMTIPAGQVRQLDGTLASVFGATNDGGAVHIETAESARLITTARTYNQTSDGTFGQFISGVTTAEAAGVGSRPLQLLQVEETDRFRTNIGIAEVSGQPVRVEIAVVPPDSKFTAVTEVLLQANEFRQLTSILRSVGLADTYNARVTVRAIDGPGRVTAYASVIDAVTQDPTYIPAQ